MPLPLVVHVIYRFALGGLEQGLLKLIHHSSTRYRHAIVSLADATALRDRLPLEAELISLGSTAGMTAATYRDLFCTFRALRPAIVHTRNLGALEAQVCSALAGVPCRIHGEHGRDIYDIDGTSRKYNLMRKALRPFVHHYTAVSRDLASWLIETVGIPAKRVTQIYNGVNPELYRPRCPSTRPIGPDGFSPEGTFIIGTVGRMQAVKDQPALVKAFIRLLEQDANLDSVLRLVLIGDGPLREQCRHLLEGAGLSNLAWLPGEREDIPDLMGGLDLFVLPSIGEGISNTILEAMASGLPVVATEVGGNPELVVPEQTGMLVPPSDPCALAAAIASYVADRARARRHGLNGRTRVEQRFSIGTMVQGYVDLYDGLLAARRPHTMKA